LVTAGLTVAAPTQWRRTPQLHFAWVMFGPSLALLGLVASILGLVPPRQWEPVLLPLSYAAIPAVISALLMGALERVRPAVGADLDSAASARFEQAFTRAGGVDALGRPARRAQVSREGAVQPFSGGTARTAGIVMLWDEPPIVLEGSAWQVFAATHEGDPLSMRLAEALS
jgi:hypothetical protein